MKKRLDVRLVELGFFPSREKAKAVIMAGQVYADGQKADKPGMEISEQTVLEVRGDTLRYVSRGGLKLEKALQVFPICLKEKICMDIGASTGGFTDCMLQNGAVKVFAIDVGYGQLAWKLRNDPRVVNLERTNIRTVTKEQIGEWVDFISIDVSFISLKLVLPVAATLLNPSGELVCLVKPQFEAGREKVGKKGVVRDRSVHLEVLEHVTSYAKEAGFFVCGADFSPVKGPEGNIEYLFYLKRACPKSPPKEISLSALVDASHAVLDHEKSTNEGAL